MRTQAVNSPFTATAQYAAFSYNVHELRDVFRARPCVSDAQIMILDAQNRSIGIQLDLKKFVSNLVNEIQASASK